MTKKLTFIGGHISECGGDCGIGLSAVMVVIMVVAM